MSRWLLSALILLNVCAVPFARLSAQTSDDAKAEEEDKQACIRNLKLIYDAIQAYQADHKDIPNWLSDLVPQYINDANVLVCPACKRTGQISDEKLSDPKIASSYVYEFTPVLLTAHELPSGAKHTRREWKRRQMGLLGGSVPLVRCFHHGKTVLNLAYDGHIYESPLSWEFAFTNVINYDDLRPARLFRDDPPVTVAKRSVPHLNYPKRSANAGTNLIDLSQYYDATLKAPWLAGSEDNLAALPTGIQTIGGVRFDVRGIIQLHGRAEPVRKFMGRVRNISIQQKCKRLVFLHAAAIGDTNLIGQQIGSYMLHFGSNQVNMEIPIIYGQDVCGWQVNPDEKFDGEPIAAWVGASGNDTVRLYQTVWTNVLPNLEIKSLDFTSAEITNAPFLVAITVE